MKQVIEEMMRNAAEEIGLEHRQENIEQILKSILNKYDIELDMNGPATWQIMSIVAEEISEWQKQTKEFC